MAALTWKTRAVCSSDQPRAARNSRIANLSVGQHWRAYLPYIAALLIGLLLIIIFPELSLFLPRAAGAIR